MHTPDATIQHRCVSAPLIFFFFQAEDGIRDYKVTGVQTCALPILPTLSETAATMSSATPPVQATSQVLGACPHDCPDTCSLVTTVEDGIAKRVQGNPAHPHTGGVLCAKVSKYTEIGRASCRERV